MSFGPLTVAFVSFIFSVFSVGVFGGEIFVCRLFHGVDHFEMRCKFNPKVPRAMLLMRGYKSIMLLLTSSLFSNSMHCLSQRSTLKLIA